MDSNTTLLSRQRGRPKGSKNQPKDSQLLTIILGLVEPSSSQTEQEAPNQLEQRIPNQESVTLPSQDRLDPNRRVTLSQSSYISSSLALYTSTLLATYTARYITAVSDREELNTVQEAKDSLDWSE
jgi:hypothetical protein